MILALFAAVPVESALAKKNKIVATINGKRLKIKGLHASVGYDDNGTIIIGTKGRRLIRTFGFGCAINPLRETTFPLTPPAEFCNANYTETRVNGSNVTIDAWLAVQGVNVTFERFDGRRLEGTFSFTLPAVAPNGAPPATIEGTFSGEPRE
jgi:hypothetical protein